ncbi:hypothetical protein [Flavobacterium sasangense]|uniref:hypothetical protein n=1 Tax=Flavobacterium sasangense TaxID=503361 RepID=UPI00047BF83B|nr:hypothetical protein [Flavobacterium sasangense]
MTTEKFKLIFVNTFNNYNWKVELKEGKIEDHCSMELNTLTHRAGDDFQLNIVTNGEDFSKQNDRIEDLMEEVHMFMGTNPNQYEVTVGITISIRKI